MKPNALLTACTLLGIGLLPSTAPAQAQVKLTTLYAVGGQNEFVALDGDTAVCGGGAGVQLPRVYFRSGGTWSLQGTLSPAATVQHWGQATSISGDRIVVGGNGRAVPFLVGNGSADIFVRSGTTWTREQTLTVADLPITTPTGNFFGESVAIDGDTLVVGRPYGHDAFVFVRNTMTGIWEYEARLTPSVGSGNFGYSSEIDGDNIIIGQIATNAAYVFTRSGTTWTEQARLVAGDSAAGDLFGWSVSIDGNTAGVGALYHAGNGSNSGAAYIYARSGTTWTQQAKLLGTDTVAGDFFGGAIDIDGDAVLIGAEGADDPATFSDRGVAYLFTRTGTAWAQQARLANPDPTVDYNYGQAVALDDGTFLVGSARGGYTGDLNQPPIADAGPDQSLDVPVTQPVNLDGSASSDPNNDTLTYSWSLTSPAGSGAVLSGASTATPSFVPDLDGDYTGTLIVNDGTFSSVADSVLISIRVDDPPTANAGVDQLAFTNAPVTLDGTGSTDDLTLSTSLTYAWTITNKPTGSNTTLSGASTAAPTLTPDLAGNYAIELIVTDASSQSSVGDEVLISASVPNAAPTADAGSDATTAVNVAYQLNGTASSDPDLDPLTYQWTLTTVPTGSNAVLAAATTATPSLTADVPGTYTASLVVNDGSVDSAAASVEIEAIVTTDYIRAKLHEADCYIAGLPLSNFYQGNSTRPKHQTRRAKISKRSMRLWIRLATWRAYWLHSSVQCNGPQIASRKNSTLRALRRAITRTDGVSLRSTPDVRHSGFRLDLITDSTAAVTVYDCLQLAKTAVEAVQ